MNRFLELIFSKNWRTFAKIWKNLLQLHWKVFFYWVVIMKEPEGRKIDRNTCLTWKEKSYWKIRIKKRMHVYYYSHLLRSSINDYLVTDLRTNLIHLEVSKLMGIYSFYLKVLWKVGKLQSFKKAKSKFWKFQF